jgi:2-isopropylmalate synthase
METEHGIVMPRRLQVEFSGVVQQHTDAHGGEVSADDIWAMFAQTYLDASTPIHYREHHLFEQGSNQGIRLNIDIDGMPHILTGEGNGPINAAVHALQTAGINIQVRSYEERSMVPMGDDGNARACAFMEIAGKNSGECYGVGVDGNIVTASIKALLSGVNRLGAGQMRQELPQVA